MQIKQILISLIIPTHNRDELLKIAIRSALTQKYDNYEIIIVDNACKDSTRMLVDSFAGSKCPMKYVAEPRPGLHNARHAGAVAASGDILMYMDDDVSADGNLLQEIVKMYRNESVGCVGGKILPIWETKPPEWVDRFPKWYLSILDDDDGPKGARYLYGCNFSIRKSLLFKVGGFNPDAFGDKKQWWCRGDGEIGLLNKVRASGCAAIYTPTAVVWHYIPRHRLTPKYFRERAFKSGIETEYSRYHAGVKPECVLCLIGRCIFCGLRLAEKSLAAVLFPRSKLQYQVSAFYYLARFLYIGKLSIDFRFRNHLRARARLAIMA